MLNPLLCVAAAFTLSSAALSNTQTIQKEFERITATSDGRVGVCALDFKSEALPCVAGDQKFPLQSVLKLVVGTALMDAVDRKTMSLGDEVVLHAEDVSPGPEAFSDLIKSKGRAGYKTNIEELLRRAIVDSDSTSIDFLIERMGGLGKVQAYLARHKIEGIRIDRNERDLQAESVGLVWKASYADSS